MANISNQFSDQILDGGKDTSGDHVAFDLGKPEFDLVQPRRIGRGEMELDVGMFFEKPLHLSGFVNGDIVQDDVDFLVVRLIKEKLFEKGDEFLTGMAGYCLSPDPSGLGIKGSKQRQGPMAIILKPVSFSPSRRHRRHRVLAVQGLDGCLFIHTKNSRVLREFDIQADDIGYLCLKVRILRGQVPIQPMRLEAGLLPSSCDHHVVDTQMLGQLAGAPVGRAVRRPASGPGQNPSFHARGQYLGDSAPVAGVETGKTLGEKTLLPLRNIGRRAA